jgi:ribonuclease HI
VTTELLVYTDGSCKAGVDGSPGGWGFVIKSPNAAVEAIERYGKAIGTQAKVMEYQAVAEAIAALPDAASALVFSDNMSLVENLSKKLDVWRQNDFKKADPLIVTSLRAIADAIEARGLKLRFQWVRGHNKNAGNERADELATQGAREAKADLAQKRR